MNQNSCRREVSQEEKSYKTEVRSKNGAGRKTLSMQIIWGEIRPQAQAKRE